MVKRIFLLLFLSSLVAACGLGSSHAVALPTPKPYRLQPGELVLAASENDIPPIMAEDEDFVPAEKADLDDLETVIGLLIGGESRAYPVRLLSLHEVVNDSVGGVPIAITWCPLCFTAIVYHREIEGQTLTFGASGYLLNDNLVMIDHQTRTLWSQLLGQGIKGAYSREQLELLPSTLTTWETWRNTYPETRVLSLGVTGKEPDQISDPYRSYYASPYAGLSGSTNQDHRLEGKDLVLGIRIGRNKIAYPLVTIQEIGLIQDQLGTFPVMILRGGGQTTPRTFIRRIGELELSFVFNKDHESLIDQETSSSWDPQTGKALHGKLKGNQLTRIPGLLVYWFAWSGFYPETEIFSVP